MKSRKFQIAVTLLFFLASAPLFAQEKPGTGKAGKTSAAPRQGQPDAEVLLVQDRIDATGSPVVVHEHRIVKIYSPAAIRRFSTLEFTYNVPRETIKLDKVNVIDADGKATSIPPAKAKTISPLAKFPAFKNLRATGLVIKNLKAGSTLDYQFTFTEKPWIAGEYWKEIFLQDVDPVRQLQIILTERKGKEASVDLFHQASVEPVVHQEEDTVIRQWEFRNIPPYPVEFSMPPPADVAPRLVITTVPNWGALAASFQKTFLEAPMHPEVLESILSSILKNAKTHPEELVALYRYVTENIRSLPEELGGSVGRISHPLDYARIRDEKLGDSRDKAAFFAALLEKAGFHPDLALLSTVGNGEVIQNLPVPFAFNRMVVRVTDENKTLWFDPYVSGCSFAYFPPEDQGREAFLLSSSQFAETPIFSPDENLREIRVQAEVSSEGNLGEDIAMKVNGADEMGMRAILSQLPDPQRKQVVASVASQIARGPNVQEASLSSLNDLRLPLQLNVKFQAKHYAAQVQDLLLMPLPGNVFNTYASILSQATPRKYPFILGNTMLEEKKLELTIPQGYQLRKMPEGVSVKSSVGSYDATFEQEKSKLIFHSEFLLKKIKVQPEDFQELQKLVANKEKLEATQLVLEKEKG